MNKVKTPTKKIKRKTPVKKKMPKSNPATMGGDSGIFCGVSPHSGEETSGSTKQKEDITAKEVEEYLKTTFKDVFREKLEKEDRIICVPAELVMINEELEPWHRGWAREVPAHCMEEGRALINDLLEAGVISEVMKPVAWCTQGIFCAQSELRETPPRNGLQRAQQFIGSPRLAFHGQ